MSTYKELQEEIHSVLNEGFTGNDDLYTKSNFKKFLQYAYDNNKGYVVYSSGGGYSDTKEAGLTADQLKKAIDNNKMDVIIKNVDSAVKYAIEPKLKSRGRRLFMRFY